MTFDEIKNYLGETPKCYITGRSLDITNPKDFHFDHIIPVSKGGDNSLGNLGIASSEANNAKSNLTLDEFFGLCKKVLEYNGYEVTKQ